MPASSDGLTGRPHLRVLVLLLAACSCGCLTPPVLFPALAPDLERALAFYPPGTSVVELEAGEGVALRGVFVPAGEGAPVVLHLVGAAQSPASLLQPLDPATWQLADLGFASLIVDYRGIGASSGETDVDSLGDDAQRMWKEAVRRAGGNPGRVIVRATSLGTIATALVLRSGARPAAILLVAPVFPDTVVERYARDSYGVLVGWFAAAAYRPVARVDVIEELAASAGPLCVTSFEDDAWSTPFQREALSELVRSRTPHDWRRLQGDHVGGVVYAASLRDGETEFVDSLPLDRPRPLRTAEQALAELGPEARSALSADPEARGRFDRLARHRLLVPADQLAAAALEQPEIRQAEDLLGALRHVARSLHSFGLLRALYSTEGSPGPALVAGVEHFTSLGGDMLRRETAVELTLWAEPVGIAESVRGLTRASPLVERWMSVGGGPAWLGFSWSLAVIANATSSDEEFRLTLARAALKAAGIPDRLVVDGTGHQRLESYSEGGWLPLELNAAGPAVPSASP